jgi:hypothetical protein
MVMILRPARQEHSIEALQQKEWSPLPNRFERRSSTSTLRLSAVYGVILMNQISSMIPGPLADIFIPQHHVLGRSHSRIIRLWAGI